MTNPLLVNDRYIGFMKKVSMDAARDGKAKNLKKKKHFSSLLDGFGLKNPDFSGLKNIFR